MTDEQIEEEVQEEVAEEQPQDEVEAQETEETQEEEVQETEDDSQELWRQAIPELANGFAELQPGTRERILLTKLAEARTAAAQAGSPNQETESADQEVSSPQFEKIPDFDTDAATQALAVHLDEDGAKALVGVLGSRDNVGKEHLSRQAYAVSELLDAVLKQGEQINRGLVVPNVLRKLVPSGDRPGSGQVPGATESDILEAQRLLASGEVSSPKMALQVAVFTRTPQSKPANPKRKAGAIRAGKQSGSPGSAPAQSTKIPQTQEDIADTLRAMFPAKKE